MEIFRTKYPEEEKDQDDADEEEKTEEAEQPQKVMEDLFAMFGRENVEIRKSPK